MAWRTTSDVSAFLAAAGGYLRRERARNTVLLTVAEQVRVNPDVYAPSPGALAAPAAAVAPGAAAVAPGAAAVAPSAAAPGPGTTARDAVGPAAAKRPVPDPAIAPLFGWWTVPGGEVAGAFLHTPPHPLLLTAVAAPVAEALAVALAGRPVPGVNGHARPAEAFAARWCAVTGQRAQVHRSMRLYRLGTLAWPEPAPDGAPRAATAGDVALLSDWFAAFAREVGELDGADDQSVAVRDKLSYGGVVIWETGGAPVSIACVTRQVAGMIRVGPVYTPPEARGRGYASAATAAVSARALDAGAEEVLLYTDLANPVSNSIYQRLGYRPVEDRALLLFSAG